MGVVLGVLASITYGAADFLGGLLTRRAGVLTVVFGSQLVGSVVMLAAYPFVLSDAFRTGAFWWGPGGGVTGAVGITLLFRGLAAARMAIVAPITGTIAAGLPVVVGLASGERPSAFAGAGVVVALLAVVLVSSQAGHAAGSGVDETAPRSGIPEAVGAGTSFGLFFILLDNAGDDTGLWPLVGARVSSVVLLGAAVLLTRAAVKPPPGTGRGIALAGVLDVAANLFYLLATREGLLSLVAVVTSMYPATTILLARALLKERMSRVQLAGLACAGLGVGLIAGG